MRLKNAIREDVLANVHSKLIQPAINVVLNDLQVVVERADADLYPWKIKQWIDTGPDGGYIARSRFAIEYHEDNTTYLFGHDLLRPKTENGGRRYRPCNHIFTLSKPVRLLACDYHKTVITLTGNKKAIERVKNAVSRLDEIYSSRESTLSTITSALQSCNTTKQLKDQYPELAEYLPQEAPETKPLIVSNELVRNALQSLTA